MKVAEDVGDYWITVREKRSKEELLEVDKFLEEQRNGLVMEFFRRRSFSKDD